MTTKHPWFKFYPQDWRGDAKLRRCSRAARSLWLDMLGIMHESDRYGFLEMDGKPLTSRDLARIFGDSWRTVDTLLEELLTAGVYSKSEAGTIFSRRMVRDAETRERRAVGGVKSLENPNVPRPKDTIKEASEGIHQGRPQIPDTRSQKLEKKEQPPRASRSRGAKGSAVSTVRNASWLAHIAPKWEAKFGAGTFPYGKAGAALKPLVEAGHATETIADYLGRYLDDTERQYVSLHRFAETFDAYKPFAFTGPPIVGGWMSDELERLTRPDGYVPWTAKGSAA